MFITCYIHSFFLPSYIFHSCLLVLQESESLFLKANVEVFICMKLLRCLQLYSHQNRQTVFNKVLVITLKWIAKKRDLSCLRYVLVSKVEVWLRIYESFCQEISLLKVSPFDIKIVKTCLLTPYLFSPNQLRGQKLKKFHYFPQL